jgi:hypothetical protein
MDVTGLVLSDRRAGLGRVRKSNIRALVHQCEMEAAMAPVSPSLIAMKRRAASLAGQYARFNPTQGQGLKQRLALIQVKP